MCLQARLELLTKLAGTARSISLLSWISAGIGLTEFFIGPTFGKLSDAYVPHSLTSHPSSLGTISCSSLFPACRVKQPPLAI
eukprot:COSAG02_NODE_4741_length_5035_cov_2.309562_4_plen_82_part_00